jgi:hypothetical protein
MHILFGHTLAGVMSRRKIHRGCDTDVRLGQRRSAVLAARIAPGVSNFN